MAAHHHGRRSKKHPNIINSPMKLRFVEVFRGDWETAARVAGYKMPRQSVVRLKADPAVIRAIELKQTQVIARAGRKLADLLESNGASLNAIIRRTVEIAMSDEDDRCQALKLLWLAHGVLPSAKPSGQDPGERRRGIIHHPDGTIEIYEAATEEQPPALPSPPETVTIDAPASQ